MPTSLNSGSMPNVRASSGMIGTMRLPISGSRMRLRSRRVNTIVVETAVGLPASNSLSMAAREQRQRRGADDAARERPAERRAGAQHVLHLVRVGPGWKYGASLSLRVGDRQLEAVAEHPQLLLVEASSPGG